MNGWLLHPTNLKTVNVITVWLVVTEYCNSQDQMYKTKMCVMSCGFISCCALNCFVFFKDQVRLPNHKNLKPFFSINKTGESGNLCRHHDPAVALRWVWDESGWKLQSLIKALGRYLKLCLRMFKLHVQVHRYCILYWEELVFIETDGSTVENNRNE